MKRLPKEREMAFAVHTANKAQVSKIYKEILHINKEKDRQPKIKWARLEQTFYKRGYLNGL